MAQQTAVDWLIDKLVEEEFLYIDDKPNHMIPLGNLINQAKEMFEQQIETAYDKGTINGIDYPESKLPLTGEQYYTQTYKSIVT
jgi:hypothetical protein